MLESFYTLFLQQQQQYRWSRTFVWTRIKVVLIIRLLVYTVISLRFVQKEKVITNVHKWTLCTLVVVVEVAGYLLHVECWMLNVVSYTLTVITLNSYVLPSALFFILVFFTAFSLSYSLVDQWPKYFFHHSLWLDLCISCFLDSQWRRELTVVRGWKTFLLRSPSVSLSCGGSNSRKIK